MQHFLSDLTKIFRTVFQNPLLEISKETKAADIDGWDSLQHFILILSIEKHFNIKFTTEESRNFLNVGQIIDSLEKKLNHQ